MATVRPVPTPRSCSARSAPWKHVGHILEKLGLADRLQAGLLLARNPLVLGR